MAPALREVESRFAAALAASGSLFAVLPGAGLAAIKRDIEQAQAAHRGRPDYNAFADTAYDFSLLDNPAVRSLFVVATPCPHYLLRVEGGPVLRLPPIYADRSRILAEVKRAAAAALAPAGLRSFPVLLPKKLVAVRSGLARYGNNGLAYLPGRGSYVRFTLFASDYPEPSGAWTDGGMLPACARCGRCVGACPAGALSPGSPWVNADACLTRHNEQPGEFPPAVAALRHHCLVGCCACQDACPLNRGKARSVELQVGADAYRRILAARNWAELDPAGQTLLAGLDMQRYFPVLRRNIQALSAVGGGEGPP